MVRLGVRRRRTAELASVSLFVGASMALPCGCERPRPTTTSLETALAAVANEQCAREGTCLHPGQHGRFTTPEECVTSVRTESEALHLEACGGSVNLGRLERCLESIRQKPCDLSSGLPSLEPCRADALCTAARSDGH